ncbi:hypothetical protein CN282_30620 [Bacillus thuringiensis]|nr:hypothetical protein CN486_23225 [Bacillus thuringiensis]RJE13275.1 hypothetical protein C0U42_16435 [Bacillus cereus]PFC20786.1 hypothetical protein CN282_30620 [Bacillus thuringiensis]PFF67866.1 hypothetical protein CN334_12515 [Bacillus thuringiensis]PFT16983.1 hypothetical protein COK84_09695 [Bacillus thuringiensis]
MIYCNAITIHKTLTSFLNFNIQITLYYKFKKKNSLFHILICNPYIKCIKYLVKRIAFSSF